jgi:hypothetical protein
MNHLGARVHFRKPRARGFDGVEIAIQGDKPAGIQLLRYQRRMTSGARRAIDIHSIPANAEQLDSFLRENGYVHRLGCLIVHPHGLVFGVEGVKERLHTDHPKEALGVEVQTDQFKITARSAELPKAFDEHADTHVADEANACHIHNDAVALLPQALHKTGAQFVHTVLVNIALQPKRRDVAIILLIDLQHDFSSVVEKVSSTTRFHLTLTRVLVFATGEEHGRHFFEICLFFFLIGPPNVATPQFQVIVYADEDDLFVEHGVLT